MTNNETITKTADDRPQLRQVLQETIDAGIIGMTLRVRDENGDWVESAGLAEIGGTAKPPIDGHFRIGSNTKTFAAALALALVDEGRIALDTPAVEYLPDFDLDPRITVRMLMQHTSGIFNITGEFTVEDGYIPGIPAAGTPLGDEWVADRFKNYAPAELVRLALAKPARFEPGTAWSYANTNYVVVRLIVEAVTGRSFGEEMRRLIIEPLGLKGTVVPDGDSELPLPHARAYYKVGDERIDVTEQNPSWVGTGGDMISTTKDMETFILALVSGRLFSAELLAEMYTTRDSGIPGMGYGLGVFVRELEGGTLITHNGGTAGHAGLMFATPDGARVLTASLNYVDDSALSMAGPFQEAMQRIVTVFFGS